MNIIKNGGGKAFILQYSVFLKRLISRNILPFPYWLVRTLYIFWTQVLNTFLPGLFSNLSFSRNFTPQKFSVWVNRIFPSPKGKTCLLCLLLEDLPWSQEVHFLLSQRISVSWTLVNPQSTEKPFFLGGVSRAARFFFFLWENILCYFKL